MLVEEAFGPFTQPPFSVDLWRGYREGGSVADEIVKGGILGLQNAFSNCYADAIHDVIRVGFNQYLDPGGRHLCEKCAHPSLAARVKVSFG